MAKRKTKRRPRRKFQVVRRGDEYWVTGFECGDMGPYEDKNEAVDDGYGVQRFYEREENS